MLFFCFICYWLGIDKVENIPLIILNWVVLPSLVAIVVIAIIGISLSLVKPDKFF